jgi:hypothetical protein
MGARNVLNSPVSHRARRLFLRTTVALASCVSMSAFVSFGLAPHAASAFVARSGSTGHGDVPGQPTHLKARVQDDHVFLRWRAPGVTTTSGVATDYVVIWDAPPILPLGAVVDTHSTLTRYSSGLGAGTYEVEAKNKNGTGPPSTPVTVCVSQSTGAGDACSHS